MSTLLFMFLFANTKQSLPGHPPTNAKLYCIFTQLGSTSHISWLFLRVLSWKLRPAKGLAVLDKRSLCFPALPALPPLSRNHKAELSPVHGVGGACGQEPCKQMSADGHHARYLQCLKTDRSKRTSSDLICLLWFQAKDIINLCIVWHHMFRRFTRVTVCNALQVRKVKSMIKTWVGLWGDFSHTFDSVYISPTTYRERGR